MTGVPSTVIVSNSDGARDMFGKSNRPDSSDKRTHPSRGSPLKYRAIFRDWRDLVVYGLELKCMGASGKSRRE